MCRVCTNEYARSVFPKYKARIYANNKKLKERNRAFVFEYLSTHPCVDCGITDIRVLEFDHRDGKKSRRYSLANRIYHVGLSGLKAEIEQCDVRCANCHRIRTSGQFTWKARVMSAEKTERALQPDGPSPST
jgi:hypothetical protein